ncbi:MAG TPA: hypothetical protein VG105_03070 [Paraburkholderia sp.]|jgi:hypothetical protein|nr:hypothetical protein [Paraburkholderia sp.]
MVDAGLSKARRWVLGAVVTVLCPLVYAKAPQMPHGGGSGGGYPRVSVQQQGRGNERAYGARNERGAPADRNVRLAHGAGELHGGGHNGAYNTTQRMAGSGGGYRGDTRSDNRGGFQYAGAITPVSAETRSVPRPPEDESLVRAGSIRADVARYNEERSTPRPVPRPPDYMQRPSGQSPYRN